MVLKVILMSRDFNKWLSTFKDSIADWKYYTDFEKVYRNVDAIKIELNILNSLINSKTIEADFRNLLKRYPEVLKVIPILLAKRESEIKIDDPSGTRVFRFSSVDSSVDDYVMFMRQTGLFDLLEHHVISDLNDYVKGVEVGLDSNARKNRTGKAMENLVETHLVRLGFQKGYSYFSQMKATDIYRHFGIDVTHVDEKKKAEKRFDFVVKTESTVYGIEVNFYSSQGSKLSETARSYKMIAQESKSLSGFNFVWITDGTGWNKAKSNLEETFNTLDEMLNIHDLESGKLENILK